MQQVAEPRTRIKNAHKVETRLCTKCSAPFESMMANRKVCFTCRPSRSMYTQTCPGCKKDFPDSVRSKGRTYCTNCIPLAMSKIRRNATSRGLSFTLTEEEYYSVVYDNLCYWCEGTLPREGTGLDRIDNLKGYEANNIVPCCTTCNVERGRLTFAEYSLVWSLRYEKMGKNPRVEARVPEDVFRLIEDRAERDGVTVSDVMREALSNFFYSESQLQGPDAGFIAARKQAHRIAMAAIAYAFEQMPESFEEAKAWADEIILRHQMK